MVLRVSFEIFGLTLIRGNNVFIINVELIAFI
jgi:hypothetical protein